MAPMFFSPTWAAAVGKALDAGPDEETLAGKLPEYWEFYRAGAIELPVVVGARRPRSPG